MVEMRGWVILGSWRLARLVDDVGHVRRTRWLNTIQKSVTSASSSLHNNVPFGVTYEKLEQSMRKGRDEKKGPHVGT